MINEEINQLIKVKVEMQLDIINFVRQSFQKLDDLIQNKYKENPKHQHFKTRKEMRAAMLRDWNPYSVRFNYFIAGIISGLIIGIFLCFIYFLTSTSSYQ